MTYVCLDNVSIDFPIYLGSSKSIKQNIIRHITGGHIAKTSTNIVTINALRDITLNLRSGDRLGLYGHNGSGKTTLLRVIAGIYAPTLGSINKSGTISSFLDIFMGMETEATGYENIITRAMIMGLSKKDIPMLVSDIEKFSGLGEYLDLPIRTYSSGMNMRLAFSLSTAFHADIVLMDEWLSVGDEQFMKSADIRLRESIERSSILVLASQSIDLIKQNCNKILTLSQGEVVSIRQL